jgi:hypothetical protein
MNNEVKDFSDIFKSWFTEEELKILEEKYNQLAQSGSSDNEQSKIN